MYIQRKITPLILSEFANDLQAHILARKNIEKLQKEITRIHRHYVDMRLKYKGDVNALILFEQDVEERNMAPVHQQIQFYKAYLNACQQPKGAQVREQNIAKAREYPIPNLVEVRHKKFICPFHEDSRPSAAYYPSDNSAYCFVCNRPVSSIDIVMQEKGMSFSNAVRLLNTM